MSISLRYEIKNKKTGKITLVYSLNRTNLEDNEVTPAGFYSSETNTVHMPKDEANKVVCIDNQYEFKTLKNKK